LALFEANWRSLTYLLSNIGFFTSSFFVLFYFNTGISWRSMLVSYFSVDIDLSSVILEFILSISFSNLVLKLFDFYSLLNLKKKISLLYLLGLKFICYSLMNWRRSSGHFYSLSSPVKSIICSIYYIIYLSQSSLFYKLTLLNYGANVFFFLNDFKKVLLYDLVDFINVFLWLAPFISLNCWSIVRVNVSSITEGSLVIYFLIDSRCSDSISLG